MSQGFRKGGKVPEVSDTTGLTPPTRVDEQRNSRRAQQITHLHQQFEDLKKKIKQVQNKNQKIIEKIHKAYNFKKKNAYTQEYIQPGQQSPVIHYQNRYDQGFSGSMSVDEHSNKSNESEKQLKLQKRSTQIASKKAIKNQKFNYSLEYGKTDVNITQGNDPLRQTYANQPQQRFNPAQMPPVYPHTSPSFTSVGSQNRLQRKLVEQLNQQKQVLEQELSEKQAEIYRVQSLMKNNTRSLKGLIQASLDEFYEQVLQKNLSAIQKAFKKYENKMKNLKKVALMMKDKQQDKKSSRLLEYGRNRRSQSKSRRNSPPRDYTRDSKIMNYSRDLKDQSRSRSKIAVQKQQKNKKQFQQIASKYEQLIKSKTQEIQKWDKKFRVKERQCYQLKMRVEVLQKRLSEQEKRSNKGSQSITSQDLNNLGKKRISTQSDLLAEIGENKDYAVFEQEIAKLQSKINQLQSISNQKSTQISNLQNLISINENKNKMIYSEYQQNLNKAKQKYQEQQQKYKKQFEKIIQDRNQQLIGYKNSVINSQKKFLEKQCEYYSLESKVKKLQGLLGSKDKKIQQLQKLVGDNCPTDRSLLMSSTILNANEGNNQAIKRLKQEIESLENRLESNRNQIFGLTKKNNYYKTKTEQLQFANTQMKKQLEGLQIQNEQLKINVNMNNISAVMKEVDHENSRQEEEIVTNSLSVMDETSKKLTGDIETMSQKINQLTKQKQQWYDKYQKVKNQGLEKQSQGIKIKSQLGFLQKQLLDSDSIVQKLKNQNQTLKNQNKQLQDKVNNLEQLLETERQQFKSQINDIERRWAQFEEEMKKSGFHAELEKSQKSSVMSYKNKNNFDYINTQNQFLTVKLKEAEAQISAQKQMQQKIIDEYQAMMQQYKIEIRNKGDHIKSLKQQIEQLNTKLGYLAMRIQASNKTELNSNNNKKQQKNQLIQRIQELQAQLKEQKQINNKLTDMEGQLFDQIKIKQQQRAQLYQQLRKKQARVQELEQIVDVRGEPVNTYASHLSQSTHKRESLKSQSSLKYSSHSQALRKSRMLNSGKSGNNTSDQKIFDLELSEAGSQFYEQPSQISNISEFFEKQQLPYQKIKIKRQQQIKLFEKTASYIKSLKKAIQQKNKKIKLLQKKIQSLKSSQLVRKQIGLDIDFKQQRFLPPSDRLEADDNFRDYQSVQLQYKRGGHLRRYKQLEHDTKLVMEENNLLIQQIQTLEQQLLKAEQQQNSLVKIKDLYKQQIKKLIKKNEEQTKSFEQQLRNQRKRVEQSESVHNIQAIKQLFTKIIQITGMKFTQQNMNTKKKEEKRKQLQQYVKVMSNILKLDKKSKDMLITCLHK